MNQNLLILGAGQYSYVVKEIAEAMGCFSKIDLLDDNSSHAIGKIADYDKYIGEYSYAAVAIGNNQLRLRLYKSLLKAGYNLPVLIHPKAHVSPSARIGPGSIIEPLVVVQANASIGLGCILSATAVVNHNAFIEDGAHCDCGTITSARGIVPVCHKVNYGAVFYASLPDDGEVRYPENYSADVGI